MNQTESDVIEGSYVKLDEETARHYEAAVPPRRPLKPQIVRLLKLFWNILVVISAVSLTVTWIGFVFGSIIGVILLLLFVGFKGFFFPMALVGFCVPVRSDE